MLLTFCEFLSTPSARRATFKQFRVFQQHIQFLSTPSARRATQYGFLYNGIIWISIHALREEGDPLLRRPPDALRYFYPRPPRGGRRWYHAGQLPCGYFYPRPPRGGRPLRLILGVSGQHISIHALREEGDGETTSCCPASSYFYPRPPRGGRQDRVQFGNVTGMDFYPRPPRGGRQLSRTGSFGMTKISIHALREEGDSTLWLLEPFFTEFLSTPSARRATPGYTNFVTFLDISIHALREEGDHGCD